MHEVEEVGNELPWMSEIDYLWGDAALKRRKEKVEKADEDLAQESHEELRKRRFKEDLALNPRKCGLTALHFPIERDLWSLETVEGFDEPVFLTNESETYDPAFILPFAMHALSVECIDAEEFVRLGFLAISFTSMSSTCEGMRKYGYELLSAFTNHLEGSQNFKGKSQINALLLFVKNAITQPWQRIPFVISLFAAEASCVLMHPEDANYVLVNRFLLRSPSIDLQSIPLFQTMFTSGSASSRHERAWMMKLLIAGLVTPADALIYRRQFVSEILMSFCTSAMAESSARRWTLKVLNGAVAIPSFAKSLLDNTGLLSWLATLAINSLDSPSRNFDYEDARSSLKLMDLLLSTKGMEAHMVSQGTEELVKVASMLLELPRMSTQWDVFSRPLFQVVKTALRLSQRTSKFQTSLSLSWQLLHEIVQAIQIQVNHDKETRLSALECLLYCPPPEGNRPQDQELLCSIARWATSELSQLENDCKSNAVAFLRWCSAAMILGAVPSAERRGFTTWWSLFTYLSEKSRLYTSSLTLRLFLSRLMISVNHGDAALACLVNILLVLLAGLPRERNDQRHWIPNELHGFLEAFLSKLPCPEELHPCWRWGYYRPWSSRTQINENEHEIYEVLLALLQQFFVNPARQIPHLASKISSRCLSSFDETNIRLEDFRRRLSSCGIHD